MIRKEMAQFVVEIAKDSAAALERCLSELGVSEYLTQVARSVVGRETNGIVAVFKPVTLEEDPLTMVSFLVPPTEVEPVATYIVDQLDLNVPGQGTLKVYSVSVGINPDGPQADWATVRPPAGNGERVLLLDNVSEIVSIVQRGEGTNISSSALNLGQSVPSVTFGIGRGLREKLNLIRITFPRDKEVMRITANADEAGDVFDQLVDAGRLDEPGKGFIYLSPMQRALPNTLLFRGSQRHAATMEQVIQAIDSIHGSAAWRQRRTDTQSTGGSQRKYLEDMDEIAVHIADGQSQRLVLGAMSAGAAGATISKARLVRLSGEEKSAAGLEVLYIIVPSAATDTILDAVAQEGLWEEKLNGGATVRPVRKACTYLG
ncbi:MAG: hypothetical protein WD492_01950 [Alkalispirochaeta sp.]